MFIDVHKYIYIYTYVCMGIRNIQDNNIKVHNNVYMDIVCMHMILWMIIIVIPPSKNPQRRSVFPKRTSLDRPSNAGDGRPVPETKAGFHRIRFFPAIFQYWRPPKTLV